MPFSDSQVKLLSSKLNEKSVKTRQQGGKTLSYIEGWHVIAEANRIFGFEGWDRETVVAECIWQDVKREPKACAYTARVRIRVRAGDTIVCREGSGVGHGIGATLGEAHESALKEAETDATKRALATFGNLFGLALYDKEQNGVRRRRYANGHAVGISWVLLSGTGALISRHDMPESFCTALRELLESTPTLDRLQAIWARNDRTVRHLRTAWPDLKTANGTHYADVLEKIHEQQVERLKADGKSAIVARNSRACRARTAIGRAKTDKRCSSFAVRCLPALPHLRQSAHSCASRPIRTAAGARKQSQRRVGGSLVLSPSPCSP